MSSTFASIQERVSEGILAQLESGGWTTAPYTYDMLEQNARSLLHKCYAVGIGVTSPNGDRQRRPGDMLCLTEVLVRHAQRIRGDAQVADYQAALVAEQALLAAVLRINTGPEMPKLVFMGVNRREVIGDGTVYLGELAFQALHQLAV